MAALYSSGPVFACSNMGVMPVVIALEFDSFAFATESDCHSLLAERHCQAPGGLGRLARLPSTSLESRGSGAQHYTVREHNTEPLAF